MTARRRTITLGAAVIVALLLSLAFPSLWLTPDQQGKRRLGHEDLAGAAEVFEDVAWRAVAHYRAGEFERAAGLFAGVDTPEAAFNRGNALVLLGRYDGAIESYDRALASRPGWAQALDNRDIARSRQLEFAGGEGTGGKLEADEIVLDDSGTDSAEDKVEVAEGEPIEGAELKAMWLRNVRTEPAEFLRLKFAYQAAHGGNDGAEEGDGG